MFDITRAYGLDFLFPLHDKVCGPSLRQSGEFARPEMEIISQLVRTAGACTYIDVGANIGSIALPVAARNQASRVIAIEGNRHLATILAANTLCNRLGNVEVHHAVVGDNMGVIGFPTPSRDSEINFGALGVGAKFDGQPDEPVLMRTLDEMAPANTRVIKIDVEGFEPRVLAGATGLIARREASWIVEHKGDERAHGVTAQFLGAGYKLFWLFAPFVTPSARKNRSRDGTVAGDSNILAIPHGDPPCPMTPIEQADAVRPDGLVGCPYLKAFGY